MAGRFPEYTDVWECIQTCRALTKSAFQSRSLPPNTSQQQLRANDSLHPADRRIAGTLQSRCGHCTRAPRDGASISYSADTTRPGVSYRDDDADDSPAGSSYMKKCKYEN